MRWEYATGDEHWWKGVIKMDKELMILRNTLMTIETKGNNTLIMADCIHYVDQLISKFAAEKNAPAETAEE